MRLALAVCALVLVAPATAFADLPVISYVDENGVFRLYDAQSGTEVDPPPPVPVANPATFRYGISASGRYILFTDAAQKLHLLDRATSTQVPLFGVDVYADPRSLTVADTGVIAFDNAGSGGAVVYDGPSAQFVATGLPALNNGHRETRLSGDGRLLATTCDDTLATCVAALDPGVDPYLQDLSAESEIGFPNNALLGEEHPCIDGDGSLVGLDQGAPGQHDVHIFDRSVNPELTLPGLNDPTKDESNCVLDAAGAYIGLVQDQAGTAAFKVYEVTSQAFLTLPADKEFDSRSMFSAAYTPPPAGGGQPAPPPSGDRTKPVTRGLRMTHRRFRVRRRATAFRFALSEPAGVRIVMRRFGRYVGQLRRRGLAAGSNRIAWGGRLRGRRLRRGPYVAVLIATDAAGNLSLPVMTSFRVLRPEGDRRP